MKFLIPLFNFVLCGDGELECNSLSCTLPPIKFDYESAGEDGPKEGSSFDSFKLLRLLMSLLIEPDAIKVMANSEEFCKKLVETLELGLGHPYKQLREEVELHLTELITPGAVAAELKRDAEERREARNALGSSFLQQQSPSLRKEDTETAEARCDKVDLNAADIKDGSKEVRRIAVFQ
eukprot:Skav220522  [mRNA]  locus=scaffold6435:5443:11377:- [translate_table: standard]